VAEHFPHTPAQSLWLLSRPTKNADGTAHISPELIAKWMRAWVAAIPRTDEQGTPMPFNRQAIHPMPSATPTLKPWPTRAFELRCCGT
jgi:hypothetical protein